MDSTKLFKDKVKLVGGLLFFFLFLAGFWLEPFSSVNLLKIDNWRYIIGLKAAGDLALVLFFLYRLLQVLRDTKMSATNKLLNIILTVLFSVFFTVGLINSLSDLNAGTKTYTGYCELDMTATRYLTTSNYLYLVEDDPNKRINITQQDYEDLTGEYRNGVPGNPYKCNRKVEVYYLEYTGVSLEVK